MDRVAYTLEVVIEVIGAVWTRYANWRIVRSLGELQILTRISYVMLVAVPLMAATWPAIRSVVNDYNRLYDNYAEKLNTAAQSYRKAEESFRELLAPTKSYTIDVSGEGHSVSLSGLMKATSAQIEHDLSLLKTEEVQKNSPTVSLPWSWAAAFFAALFIVVGHTLYQMSAPEDVRRYTLIQFGARISWSWHWVEMVCAPLGPRTF